MAGQVRHDATMRRKGGAIAIDRHKTAGSASPTRSRAWARDLSEAAAGQMAVWWLMIESVAVAWGSGVSDAEPEAGRVSRCARTVHVHAQCDASGEMRTENPQARHVGADEMNRPSANADLARARAGVGIAIDAGFDFRRFLAKQLESQSLNCVSSNFPA